MTNYQKYSAYLYDVCSPRQFIRWNYYFSISSILARKVWFSEDSKIFPNLYIVNVGPPSVGKSWPATLTRELLDGMKDVKIIPGTEKLLETPLVNLSPQSLTTERLYDLLADSVESIKFQDDPPKFYVHSSISFYHTEELTTLFQKNQDSLVDFFVQGWNGGSFKRETKASGKANIQNMCINLCSCTTVNRLADCMASKLMTEGFTSRVLFIYGDKPFHRVPIFKPDAEKRAGLKEVKEHWKELGKVFGEVKLSSAAHEWLAEWITKRMDIHLNKDKRLEDYYGRKYHHLVKMAMVCHFSESLSMTLGVEDFEEALRQLELVEVNMHRALKGMGANPLHRLAEEIRNYLEANGPTTYKKLLAEFFDGGNHEDIEKAVQHKVIVGDFSFYNDSKSGQPTYKLLDSSTKPETK
jgi:hypothetical protein